MNKILTIGSFFLKLAISAQVVTMNFGEETEKYQIKNSNEKSFISGENYYFLTTNFSGAQTHYYLESFGSKGESLGNVKLEIPVGVYNNSFSISDVLGLEENAFVTVEHLDKPSGKKTLYAKKLNVSGNIANDGKEIMSFSFSKTMNSGFNLTSVSPNQKKMAVIGLLPYEKKMSAKVKVAVYDENLNEVSSSLVTIPGADTKNKRLIVNVANDGTVYLTKRTKTSKRGIILEIFQVAGESIEKEYTFDLTLANRIYSHIQTVNDVNELIIAGTYYEQKSLVVGNQPTNGIFYFTNKEKKEGVFRINSFDTPINTLESKKILFNDNTVFLAAEQLKETRQDPAPTTAGTPAAFDYNYIFDHGNEYVFGLDFEGNSKFQLEFDQSFSVRNFHQQYQSSYSILGDKFTIVYNDLANKFLEEGDTCFSSIMPILVQVSDEGLMTSPVQFKNELKVPYSYTMYPSISIQKNSNQIVMLMKNNDFSKFVNLKVED